VHTVRSGTEALVCCLTADAERRADLFPRDPVTFPRGDHLGSAKPLRGLGHTNRKDCSLQVGGSTRDTPGELFECLWRRRRADLRTFHSPSVAMEGQVGQEPPYISERREADPI
jgi:hypothetical protein